MRKDRSPLLVVALLTLLAWAVLALMPVAHASVVDDINPFGADVSAPAGVQDGPDVVSRWLAAEIDNGACLPRGELRDVVLLELEGWPQDAVDPETGETLIEQLRQCRIHTVRFSAPDDPTKERDLTDVLNRLAAGLQVLPSGPPCKGKPEDCTRILAGAGVVVVTSSCTDEDECAKFASERFCTPEGHDRAGKKTLATIPTGEYGRSCEATCGDGTKVTVKCVVWKIPAPEPCEG